MYTFIIIGCILQVVYLAIMIYVAQTKRDMSIVNFTWGGGVALNALYSLLAGGTFYARQCLVTTLTLIWATRLAYYVYARYKGDDPRFQSWKHEGGLRAFILNLLYMFGPQALTIALMSTPVLIVNFWSSAGITLGDLMGTLLWIVGFYWEVVGDLQLYTFVADPAHKGRILTTGLWRYSRHPNYFGEITMWWALFIIALSVDYGWIAVSAPLTITFLLLFVTGVPWIEKIFEDNLEYQDYKRKTSMLIPWFPRK